MITERAPLGGTESAPSTDPQPVTLDANGLRVYGMYRPATGEPPPGVNLAVLILEQQGSHRMNVRLARALATAGYPSLAVDFRGQGESEGPEDPTGQRHLVTDELVADARLALAELRRRAEPEHVVVFGACRAGHVAAHCAAADQVDGLMLAGIINFDDQFRRTYRGAMPGKPRMATLPTMSVFDTLVDFQGPLLLLHGKSDPYMNADRLLELAEAWLERDPGHHLEMRIADGSDHSFSARPREQIVITEAVAWLERRFGRGYPRAWQGPPPTMTSASTPPDEDPAAQVPRIVLVGMVVPADADAPAGSPPWRLELQDGRAYGLNDSLRRVVTLIDGRRSVAEIAAALSEQVGRSVTSAQVMAVIRDRLTPMGIVVPDAREEGDEDDAGMTDILIRCYSPGDRTRDLLENLTRVTRSPYNVILTVGKRSAVRNQNLALDRARTRYAVFLDDDILLTEGWLERLRETMDRTGAGAVSARQLRMDGSPLASGAACEKGEIVEIAFGGACFMFRTDLGLRFDENFVRSQWDDFDFLFQFYERGYKAYIDGRVEFYHHADPKIVQDQNYDYFVRKWSEKGMYRGLMYCRYPNGHRGYLPNFGT
jgi:dienelactone hydrolase